MANVAVTAIPGPSAVLTALAWILGVAHSLGVGTDAGAHWFVAGLVAATAPPAALLALRLAGRPLPGAAAR